MADESTFQPLKDYLSRIPAIEGTIGCGFSDDGLWWVKFKPTDLKGRARQNVILELGYFNGKLSRRRVCALYKPNVEIPSDYQGVLYVELDTAGAWRTKLAQELVEAGFSINLEALLKS